MKYEADLLAEIIANRGHEKSSIHYESECIESWIEESKGAYPKLCDYESEWLNYMVENPIGKFPYETITDVTEATINNVVPFAYKSAILTGQTLVNICKPYEFDIQTTGSGLRHLYNKNYAFNIPIQDDKQYSIWIEIDINEIGPFSLSHTGAVATLAFDPIFGLTLTHGSTIIYPCVKRSNSINVDFSIGAMPGSTEGRLKGRVMVFEGDVRGLELSYFEGMQSVKMPVLTTVGKNIYHNSFTGYANSDFELTETGFIIRDIPENGQFLARCELNVKKDTDITINFNRLQNKGVIWIYEDDLWGTVIKQNIGGATTFRTKTGKVVLGVYGTNWKGETVEFSNIQIEYGKQATSYEPFKSNILSCLEPVELGSVGEVKDELNLLTQQLTQRTETRAYQEGDELNSEFVTDMTNTRYKLAQEVVKTVDLSIIDQDGQSVSKLKPIEGTMHMETDGQQLKPLLSAEIPVEAITQNLASFIEEE